MAMCNTDSSTSDSGVCILTFWCFVNPSFKNLYYPKSSSSISFEKMCNWNSLDDVNTCWPSKFHMCNKVRYFHSYRPGHPKWELPRNGPLIKNPQFLSNFAETLRAWPSHGMINIWKFEQNWTKIVDFLIIAYFQAILT